MLMGVGTGTLPRINPPRDASAAGRSRGAFRWCLGDILEFISPRVIDQQPKRIAGPDEGGTADARVHLRCSRNHCRG
jgi:hypothetical protein